MSTMRITKDHTRDSKPFKKGELVSVPFKIGQEMLAEDVAVYANLPSNMKPKPVAKAKKEHAEEPADTGGK